MRKFAKTFLSGILAAAMIFTSVPTAVYAEEAVPEAAVETEAEELAVPEAEVVEETPEEVVNEEVAPEEESEDTELLGANNDIALTVDVGTNTHLTVCEKNGDDYSDVSGFVTSDFDYTFYIKPADGYKLNPDKTEPLTLEWQDFTACEKHTPGQADTAVAGYVANKTTTKPADGYSVGELNADGYYPVTISSAFLQNKVINSMYLKDGKWALGADDTTIIGATLGIELAASLETEDTFLVEVKSAGDVKLENLLPGQLTAKYDSNYTLALSGGNCIKGGDSDSMAAGIQAGEIKVELVKKDGTVVDKIVAVEEDGTAVGMLIGMDRGGEAGTARVMVAGDDSFASGDYSGGQPNAHPDRKTLYIAKVVINSVYASLKSASTTDDLKIVITLGKDADPDPKTYTITATDTEFVDFTLGTGIKTESASASTGTFIAKGETGATDIVVNAAVKKAADRQEGDASSVRTLGIVSYKVGSGDAKELAGGAGNKTIPVADLTNNIVVSSYTLEAIANGNATTNYTLYNTDGTLLAAGNGKVETGKSFSFTVRPKTGYSIATSNGVVYRLGNETTDHVLNAVNGVYTVPNVNNTLTIYVNTVVVGQKWSVKTTEAPDGFTVTSEGSAAPGDIDETGTDAATDAQTFYFTVAPVAGVSIENVQYRMKNAQGTFGEFQNAKQIRKDTATGNITCATNEAATGDIEIKVTKAGVVKVYGATNANAKVYAIIDNKDVELKKGDFTLISTASDFYFKVVPASAKTKVTGVKWYDSATRDDDTAGTVATLSKDGHGSLTQATIAGVDASKSIWFKVYTTTEKTIGTDFVAYVKKSAGVGIDNSYSSDYKEVTGQSLKLAQSETSTIAVDIFPGAKKLVANGDKDHPAFDEGKTGTPLSSIASTKFELKKDTDSTRIAKITADGGVITTSEDSLVNYKEYLTGTDKAVITVTADPDGTFDSAVYTAELPLTVVPHYSEFRAVVDHDAVAIKGTVDPTFAVEGLKKDGTWEVIDTNLASTGKDCIESITWSWIPDQTGLVNPIFVPAAVDYNKAKIDADAVTTKIAEPMEITATASIKLRGNRTDTVTKSAKVNFVAQTYGYIAVPVVSVKDGSEYWNTIPTGTTGVALQKANSMNSATVKFRVFEKTALGDLAGTTAADLESDAEIAAEVEAGNVVEVTDKAVFSNDSVIKNYHGANVAGAEPYAETAPEYNEKYVTVSGSKGTYTITATKKTPSVSGPVYDYANFAPTIKVNSLTVDPNPAKGVFFTVANNFPSGDLTLKLTDEKNLDSKSQPVVQVLDPSYMSGYNRAQLLDENVEIGQVIKNVTVGSKIKLPTQAQLATTTASNRVLLGFTDSYDYYEPGEEVTYGLDKVFKALWGDKYILEGLYNKNLRTVDEEGVVSYGETWAGWNGSLVNPAMDAGGTVPVIGKILTATKVLSNAAKDADDLLPAEERKYVGMLAGATIFTDEYKDTGISIAYDATATADQKAAATVGTIGGLTVTANAAIDNVPFVATYTVGEDKYLMQTDVSDFTGAFGLAVAPSATYTIVKPEDQTFYVGQDPAATALTVTVQKNDGAHGLTKEEIIVSSANTSAVKVEVKAATGSTATLAFEPVSAGTSEISVSVKDAQGITSEVTKFNVEVKDEGISFAFFAEDGTTAINKLDVEAGAKTAKFIVRAMKSGSALQTGSWNTPVCKAPAASASQVIEDGFGRLVTVTSEPSTFSSEGKVTVKYTSESGVTYAKDLTVRSYYNAAFTKAANVKEILVNGVPYKESDLPASYNVRVFEDDKNADKKYEISLDGISASYKPADKETKDFSGWTDSASVLTEATKTGKVAFTADQIKGGVTFTANFDDAAITFDGITDGETIVLESDSEDKKNHKQFTLDVEPYNSEQTISVTADKKGFYQFATGTAPSDYVEKAVPATVFPVEATVTKSGDRRRDTFYVGVASATAGSAEFTVSGGEGNEKKFTLVTKGANFANPTAIGNNAFANIVDYVDYDASKGAYKVTLDKRAVKAEGSTSGTFDADVYFDAEGKPVQNGVATLTNGDGKSYLLKEYALLYGAKGGVIKTVDGFDYLVDENAIVTVADLATVGEVQYYFNSEGKKVTYDMTEKAGTPGKYTDPETKIVYVIDKDTNAAAPDKLRVNAKFEWTTTKPSKFEKSNPLPTSEFKIAYNLEGEKETLYATGTVTAVADPADYQTKIGLKKLTLTFTASETDLAGYFSDAAGTKPLTASPAVWTYNFNGGSSIGTGGGIEIDGFEEGQEFKYTGAAIKPVVKVYDNDLGEELKLGVDYSLSYKNNTKISKTAAPDKKPIVTVNGKGNYTGKTVTRTFEIVDPTEGETDLVAGVKKINSLTFSVAPSYTGEAWYPDTITVDGVLYQHESGEDYTSESTSKVVFSFSNNVDAGTATVSATGADKKTKKKTFKIAKIDLSKQTTATLEIVPEDAEWAVKGVVPEVKVTYTPNGGTPIELVPGQDFTVATVKKDVSEGNTVKITGKGTNFQKAATSTNTFEIKPCTLTDESIVSVTAYAGQKKKNVKATVVDGNGVVIKAKSYTLNVYDSDSNLLADRDVIKAGEEYKVEVVAPASGNLTGSGEFEFTAASDMSKAKVSLSTALKKNGVQYTGEAIDITQVQSGELIRNLFDSDITVQYKNPTTKKYENLTYGEDFEVAGYQNNVKKGQMTVYIRANSDSTKVSGVKSFKIKISAKTMNKAE